MLQSAMEFEIPEALPPPAVPAPTRHCVSEICAAVAKRFKIPVTELRGESRAREFALPRQMAMFIARELTGASTTRLGKIFHRDHSTVIHACRATAKRLEKHSGIREHYVAIVADLRASPGWMDTIKAEKDAAMSVGLFVHGLGVSG